MGTRNPGARRYLREVRGRLPCSRRAKSQILNKIKDTIMDYLAQNPDAMYSEITARFGTPQQIAASFVDEMETGELLQNLKIKRRIMCCVVAAVAIIVALWAGVVTRAYLDHVGNMNGYFTEEIIVVDEAIETD